MRKYVTVLIIMVVAGVVYAQSLAGPKQPEYWQDLLPKPNQAWIVKYGLSDESQLAFCVAQLITANQAQARLISQLRAEIEREKDGKSGQTPEKPGDGTAGSPGVGIGELRGKDQDDQRGAPIDVDPNQALPIGSPGVR